MTVKEIVIKYLKDNGYDGLYFSECGCEIEDLMCCGAACDECEPGYKHKSEPDDGLDLVICPEKPEEK